MMQITPWDTVGARTPRLPRPLHISSQGTFVGWDWEMEGLLQAEMDIPCTMWVNDSCHHSNDMGVA